MRRGIVTIVVTLILAFGFAGEPGVTATVAGEQAVTTPGAKDDLGKIPDDGEGDAPPGRESTDVSEADCDWAEATLDRLNALAPAGAELQGMDDDDADPDRLREIADDLVDAAAEQRDSDPPAVAEEANEQIADALDLYADALDVVAGAIDEGETPDTLALLADVEEANGLIADAGEITAPLLAECSLS